VFISSAVSQHIPSRLALLLGWKKAAGSPWSTLFSRYSFSGMAEMHESHIGRKSARPSSNVVSNDLRQQQRVCRPSTVKKCRRHRRRLFAIVIERRKRVQRVSNFHIDNWKRNKFSFFLFLSSLSTLSNGNQFCLPASLPADRTVRSTKDRTDSLVAAFLHAVCIHDMIWT
jgi:hypothetical protein